MVMVNVVVSLSFFVTQSKSVPAVLIFARKLPPSEIRGDLLALSPRRRAGGPAARRTLLHIDLTCSYNIPQPALTAVEVVEEEG